ncbi:MAG: hypothetical protein IJI88_01245 [Atopobiaceae bacterium]|nr:hypothetical protein [Olsenella sp.]MBQ6490880.1 hypothetical protein [Atopobiaceae bacterium]
MSKKINERIPVDSGDGAGFKKYNAVQTPWNKLFSYQEALHYASRFESVLSAAVAQAYRIIIPDYETRAQEMCEEAHARLLYTGTMYPADESFGIHPFMCGMYPGALIGDKGDDALLMCGRCQDFGTYRAEKELDVCDWDICCSELCRATTMSLCGQAEATATRHRPGKSMDYMMVEAKGCGDRHCRIIAESREKYPAPEHALWESFGPAVSDDYKKFTEEEDCVAESMMFREETDYHFVNGTNEETDSSNQMINLSTAASLYLLPAIDNAVRKGYTTRENADWILKCVLEAAGKAMFGERYAILACREWLGVPLTIGEDGRILGGLIEVLLQSLLAKYEVEAFNENEVILVIDRGGLAIGATQLLNEAHLWMWHGMVKTLVNAQWSVWEEDSPEGKMRVKIAKKIDKFM